MNLKFYWGYFSGSIPGEESHSSPYLVACTPRVLQFFSGEQNQGSLALVHKNWRNVSPCDCLKAKCESS